MSPPTTNTAQSSPVTREGSGSTGYLPLPTLIREGQKVAAAHGFEVSQHRMSRIIRRFIRETRGTDVNFRTWFLTYADPTGEDAVRHVMAGR